MAETTENPVVAQLKASLEASHKREEEIMAIARELLARNQTLNEQVKHLTECVQKLEGTKINRGGKQGWASKIIHIINRTGRPMRSTEILHEMYASDTDGKLQGLSSVKESLSVNLSRAVNAGKLKTFKVLSVRGLFYALPKWVNTEGDLPQEMWDQMY